MIRLVVTGGRAYADTVMVDYALDTLHQMYGIGLLIQGDAAGADRLCKNWAITRNVPRLDMPARWWDIERPGAVIRTRRDGSKYDAAAGLLRNQEMIDVGHPDYAVAFAGGTGTADMVERIKRVDLPLWDLRAYWSSSPGSSAP